MQTKSAKNIKVNKIVPIRKYRQNQPGAFAKPTSKPVSKKYLRPIVLALSLGFVLSSIFTFASTYMETRQAAEELELAKQENRQAIEENRQAQLAYQLIQTDDYLAQVARRDYYYSKPGEIIFVMPQESVSNE